MKLAFLSGEYPPMQGGIADYTANLARQLAGLEAKPIILTSHRWKRFAGKEGRPLLAVHPVVSNWGPACWGQTRRFCQSYQVDVLHIQYQAAAFDLKGWVNWLPWWFGRRPDRPHLVVTCHDLRIPYIFPKAGRFRWKSILALARYSDATICTNQEDLETLRRELRQERKRAGEQDRNSAGGVLKSSLHLGPPAPRLYHIPLGSNIPVDPPPDYNRDAWRASLGFDPKTWVLAYFGFLNESKGGEELILVLDSLLERGYNARLLMIGAQVGDSDPTNVSYRRRMRHLINEHDLAERISFTGYASLSKVSAHLLAADVAVVPYRDGVSLRRTTLVAMLQHGLPVVSTLPLESVALIRDGENMLLVPPRDVAALTSAVQQLLDEPDLRQKLGHAARDLGRNFHWPDIARQTMSVYQDLGCV